MPSIEQKHNLHQHGPLHSVEETKSIILQSVDTLTPEKKPLIESLGQVLSKDIKSAIDIPPFPNSSVDGYAVIHSDVISASKTTPVKLKVSHRVFAGETAAFQLESGHSARIMTGAPIPQNTSAIIPFELTNENLLNLRQNTRENYNIEIHDSPSINDNIRPQGEDVKKNTKILTRGTILKPADIGLCASIGLDFIEVFRRPKVAILSTGNELLHPGEKFSPGKIFDSNSYSLYSSIIQAGGIPLILGIAQDSMESLEEKLQEAFPSDMLITSAGVSKGDYDIVKDFLSKNGKIKLWSVNMKPGKPLAFGSLKRNGQSPLPHIGLPGNPVSSLVAFHQFVRPAIYKMMGRKTMDIPTIKAVLENKIENTDGRRVYARVLVSNKNGEFHARLSGSQASNVLSSMSVANGLAICPENIPAKNPGEVIDVQMLDWNELEMDQSLQDSH